MLLITDRWKLDSNPNEWIGYEFVYELVWQANAQAANIHIFDEYCSCHTNGTTLYNVVPLYFITIIIPDEIQNSVVSSRVFGLICSCLLSFFSNQAKYLINDHFLGVTIDSLLVITKKDSLQVHLAMSFRSITTEIPQPVGKSRITKRFSRRSDQSIVNKLVYKFHTW